MPLLPFFRLASSGSEKPRRETQPTGYGSTVSLTDGPYDTDDEPVLSEYARAIEIWATALTQLRALVDYSVDLRTVR